MATQVQRRRGTDVQNAAFTGAEGEFTYDTVLKTIRVHDGETAGGAILVKRASTSVGTTKCKITYDDQGLVVGGSDLTIDDLPLSALSDKYVEKELNEPTGIGTKCKITFNNKGLVTKGENLTTSDLPDNIPQAKIQNLSTALDGKMPQIEVKTPTATSASIQLYDNAINKVVLTGSATLLNPVIPSGTSGILHQALVQLHKQDAAYTVTIEATKYFGSNAAPDLTAAGFYNIYYEYDSTQNAWVVGAIRKQ